MCIVTWTYAIPQQKDSIDLGPCHALTERSWTLRVPLPSLTWCGIFLPEPTEPIRYLSGLFLFLVYSCFVYMYICVPYAWWSQKQEPNPLEFELYTLCEGSGDPTNPLELDLWTLCTTARVVGIPPSPGRAVSALFKHWSISASQLPKDNLA